jgi:hypothetical protein
MNATVVPACPVTPDVGAWTAKAIHDVGLPNPGAVQLERALAVLAHQAVSDLVAPADVAFPAAGRPDQEKVPNRQRRRRERRRRSGGKRQSRLIGPFRLLIIVATGILGVALAERAFFVFLLSPTETRVVVVAIELLFVYAGHRIGVRKAAWPHLDRRARNVTRLVALTFASALAAVFYVRAAVLVDDLADRTSQLSLPVGLWMFLSLGTLLATVAIEAGMASHEGGDVAVARGESSRDLPPSLSARRHVARQRWLACQAAYHHAYLSHAPTELLPELERVRPPDIRLDSLPRDDENGETRA